MNLEKYFYWKLKSTYIQLNLSSYLLNDIMGTEFLFQELQIFYYKTTNVNCYYHLIFINYGLSNL